MFTRLNGVQMVCIMRTMKRNQRTVKIYDSTHATASRLSNRFGVSMVALVEIAVRKLAEVDHLVIPPRDLRSRKVNARRAVA